MFENDLTYKPKYPCLLTAQQVRACEQFTTDSLGVDGLELMERAGRAVADSLAALAAKTGARTFCLFCGSGNNGGDGLVAARHLALRHFETHVILCCHDKAHRSACNSANLRRWRQTVAASPGCTCVDFDGERPVEVPAGAVIVDALFGIGLNRPAEGVYAEAIRLINGTHAFTVAVDVPSGLFTDSRTDDGAAVVRADATLTVQFMKPVFMLPETFPYCGEVSVLDVGIEPMPGMPVRRECVDTAEVRGLLRPRPPYAHKGTFGHGLLVAGSDSMPGAAILSAAAALRGGMGKLTVHTAGLAARCLPAALPEAILHVDKNACAVSAIDWDSLPAGINALAVGPGIGNARCTVNLVKDILDTVHSPIVIDADALNVLAENKAWLADLHSGSILTPHFKEFERLAGRSADGFGRIERAGDFARRYSVILILKGFHTVVSMPDGRQFFNMTGNAGMATAGSGDVLTGLLLSLLSQGYPPPAAALLAVYIHGKAGDFAARQLSQQSMLASDITRAFGKVFRLLENID